MKDQRSDYIKRSKINSHLNCLCLSDLSFDDGILRVAPLGDRLLKKIKMLIHFNCLGMIFFTLMNCCEIRNKIRH